MNRLRCKLIKWSNVVCWCDKDDDVNTMIYDCLDVVES